MRMILTYLGEPASPPPILPARDPPQREFEFDQTAGWAEDDLDQTRNRADDLDQTRDQVTESSEEQSGSEE
jgi:hypothetical protein